MIMAVSGTGPLWFIQVLWLLCIVLLIVRALDKKISSGTGAERLVSYG